MLRSHDLSCLSVFGGFPGGYETFRSGFGGASTDLIVEGLGPPKDLKILRSSESLKADYLTRRVRFARRIVITFNIIIISLIIMSRIPYIFSLLYFISFPVGFARF